MIPLSAFVSTGLPYSVKRGNNYVITAAELAEIPVFDGLDEAERQRFAQKAADIHVEAGDWVIREGEDPRFFVLLEGMLQTVKDILGQRRELDQVSRVPSSEKFPFSWVRQISSPCRHSLVVAWTVSIASSFRN
jgi:hypothetical protein